MSRRLAAQEFKALYNKDPKNATIGKTKTVEGDTPAATKVTPMTGTEAYQAKEKLTRQRQLGKITVTEFNAGMAKIKQARTASR